MVRAMLWAPLALLSVLAPFANADVKFTSPSAGATAAGGSAITIEWTDSGTSPAITDLTTYELFLCAGGNDATSYIQLLAITASATSFVTTGNKATGTIGLGLGASTKNAYFFKMISTAAKGGTVTNFSPRFSLSGMTGTFPDTVVQGLKSVTGTDSPDRIDSTGNAAPSNPADSVYGVDYTMQTGLTRYAPMQPVPPTKITKKNASPLHPTSAFTIATTLLAIPSIQTTITQSQTFSVSSRANTVAAAAMPSDDMAKFLRRWQD